jgi:hypothetical protein
MERQFCIIRTRKFYGPDYKYSLVSALDGEGEETGSVIFESREAAQKALEAEEESITRGYGCYCCAHNESGSPDFEIVSTKHPRAARLLRELKEVA